MLTCDKDCTDCKKLNIKTDNLGYPWGYDCLKYGDSVLREQFKKTKEFPEYKQENI